MRKLTLLKDNISSEGEYPFSIPSIRSIETLTFRSNFTFFVGENGSGKSTLLEAIAYCCGFNTAGGGRNNTYNVPSCEAVLGEYIRLSWSPKVTKWFFLEVREFL
ncbi:MAG: AAA family ATPase [Paludibacter sp.]|nr:AAA family ATPase [Paludibacter sp.]